MANKLTCFKAYDIRGRLGRELNDSIAYDVGRAYGQYLKPETVALGCDARPSSPALKAALARGLIDSGVRVLDLGLCGTEEIYFAVFSQNLSGGIEVTGSHNPLSDNGFKLVRERSRPVSSDSGLDVIRELAESRAFTAPSFKGCRRAASFKNEYIEHLVRYVEPSHLRPLKIVTNPGHGTAGPVIDLLESRLKEVGAPLEFIKIGHAPDGSFPLGLPNPLLPENRAYTTQAVLEHGADLALAWDGDFDRCFFFDEKGGFIEGYYLVGLLAEVFVGQKPGATIIHDPRLTWNTVDIVENAGGRAVESRTGHAFMKERMALEEAVYGGEMSAHHYFSDFAYCDSGMIPWLMVIGLMTQKDRPLSELVAERQAKFPCSGEINYQVAHPAMALKKVEEHFNSEALKCSRVDGLSLEMPLWRFNLRASNTEPLLRLNLESRGDQALIQYKLREVEKVAGLTP